MNIGELQLREYKLRQYVGMLKQDVQNMVDMLDSKVESFIETMNNEFKIIDESILEFEGLKKKKNSLTHKDLNRLVELFSVLNSDKKSIYQQSDSLLMLLKYESKKLSEYFRHSLKPNIDLTTAIGKEKPDDFRKFGIDHTFVIPGSNGVGYEATDFIPEMQLLAIGTYHDRKGDLVLWDVNAKSLKAMKKNIHDVGITYVRWIPSKKFIVTSAYDKLIKISRLSTNGEKLDVVKVLRGHSMRIRCLVSIPELGLLVTGGDEPDLKIWNMNKMTLTSLLSTRSEGLLGSYLLYIKSCKVIGVSFKSGKIRLFDLFKKIVIFEFNADSMGRYPCGLQMLSKRSQVICNTNENTIKVWDFDELNMKIKTESVIKTEGKEPNCMIANADQEQLLLGCLTSRLEIYDYRDHKTKSLELNPHIKEANSLVYMKGMNRISICDRVSGTVCILKEMI